MRVFLIRHPEPVRAAGMCYGQTDLPVAPDALDATVNALRGRLPERFDAVWSSPLRRCTALAAALSESYECDERVVEIDFGAWESVRWDDIDRTAFDEWAADYVHRRPPGGECWDDVQRRAGAFLDELRPREGTAAVVTHAGVIRALVALVLGVPLEPTWRLHVPFGCVAEITVGPERFNDRLVSLASPAEPSA